HEHGVGTGRHRSAGENADRLAIGDRLQRRMTGGDAIDHREARLARACEAGVPHPEAVDGGIVERRQGGPRDHVGGEPPPGAPVELTALGLDDGSNPLGKQPFDLLHGKRWAAEGEAVVGELRHQTLPPQPASAATGTARASIRSATASTSSSATTGTRACGTGASDATATMCGSSGWSDGLPTAAR